MDDTPQTKGEIVWRIFASLFVGAISVVGFCFVYFILASVTHCIGIGPCGFGDGPNSGTWVDYTLKFFLFACPVAVTISIYYFLGRKSSSKYQATEVKDSANSTVELEK